MAIVSDMLYPIQRLPYKEKIKNDCKWAKDMFDYMDTYYQRNYYGSDDSDFNRKLSNYEYYNNILNQEEFERDCNLLGIEVGQFKDEVKAYNKTPNKIQVLLGEELRRPFSYRAILQNSEGIRGKQLERTELLKEVIMKGVEELIQLIRELNKDSQDPAAKEEVQRKIQAIVPEDELKRLSDSTYLDQREILANKLLSYLIHALNLREKMNDGFKHGLLSGEEAVWVGIRNDNPVVEVINSLSIFYEKSPEVKYIQDGRFAGSRTMMAVGDVIDRYMDELSEEDLKKLEGPMQGINGIRDDLVGKQMKYHNVDIYHEYMSKMRNSGYDQGSYGDAWDGDHVLVTHIEWKSYRKVYFYTYINDYGDIQKDILSEEFEIPKNFQKMSRQIRPNVDKTVWTDGQNTIEEAWIPEIWEATRIGFDIYVGIGPKKYQHRNLDNPFDVKLGYHGLVYNNMNASPVSLMDRMKPFQNLYLFVMHKLKQLIAKDKGKLFHMDLSMVPENMDFNKVLYYLEHLDLDLYNSLQNAQKPGATQRGKVTTATDRSNMQHIMNYVNLLDALDMQISDVAGIPKPREGHTPQQQAVTNAQQDLAQSSAVTEAVYFQPHYNLWRNVLSSLLECTQACWKDKGMIKQYVLDDMSIATLSLTPGDLSNSSFGIFISNTYTDSQIFDTLKALTQPLIQNDKAKMSDIIKIMKSSSVAELEQYIELAERKGEEMYQAQLQQQEKINQQQLAAQREVEEDRQAHEKELKQMEIDADIKKEELKMQLEEMKIQLQEKELNTDKIIEDKKIEVEKQKVQAMKNRPSSGSSSK